MVHYKLVYKHLFINVLKMLSLLECPLNCKDCDAFLSTCTSCLDGYTKANLSDTKCSYCNKYNYD